MPVVCTEDRTDALQGRRFVTYPTEFVKTRSQFGGKVRNTLRGGMLC